jgi:hypothetical protein
MMRSRKRIKVKGFVRREEEKAKECNLIPPEVSCQELERVRGLTNFLEVMGNSNTYSALRARTAAPVS